ncbi:MAG: twin-arginine translocation pathway signal [Thiothrix nivea]|nr:MAG: twin-arginine translocation pathway signal [Thiothrix nivea]
MMMQRRQFLALAGSLLTLGVAGAADKRLDTAVSAATSTGDAGSPHFLYSANDNRAGQHFLSRVQLGVVNRTTQPLPFRAHDVLPLANGRVLAFGRRPDTMCADIDLDRGEQRLIEAAAGRHFYGHGCFSAAGSVLFTTENDYEAVRGVIGIRDAATYEQIGEYETYGVGPHDIHLMPDGQTLVIANGGIETHPDFGRRKLNLKTMQPSLAYVDSTNGKKMDEYRLDDHQLSIRHLTVTAAGDVGVAMQYQGDIYRHQPQTLVAWQQHGGELKALQIAESQISTLRGYMADLAYADDSGVLAVTSPRGNRISFWDVAALEFISALEITEPSGIQYLAQQQAFLVSAADGSLYRIPAHPDRFSAVTTLLQAEDMLWDNHMYLV